MVKMTTFWVEACLRNEHQHHHSSPTCAGRRRRWTRLSSLRWRHDDVIIPGVVVVMATLLLQRCGQCWNGVIHHVKTRINDKLDETWKRICELRFTSRHHALWLSFFCPFSSAHDMVNVIANICCENSKTVAYRPTRETKRNKHPRNRWIPRHRWRSSHSDITRQK